MHTLHHAVADRGGHVWIDHRAFALELLNREPNSRPLHDEEVATITAVRTDLDWSPWTAPDWAFPVTTLPAMAAVQATKQQQGLEAADALDTAIRRAYFVHQRCISLLPVIEDIARDCAAVDADALLDALHSGVGQAAVFADLDVARTGHIQGSPHLWTANGPFGANPGVDDPQHFKMYDASWIDHLLSTNEGLLLRHGAAAPPRTS